MPITRDYVQSLTGTSTSVVVQESALAVMKEFARDATSTAGPLRSHQNVDPSRLVNKHELADLVAQADMVDDLDAAEVYVLGLMAGAVNRLHLPEYLLALRRGITTRIHDLLEARPELLHRRLRFPKSSNDGLTPLLRYLVLSGATLDPDRLVAMAAGGGFAGQMLQGALQHGKSVAAPLLEAAMKRTTGCASTALAILRADPQPQEMDDEVITRLWGGLASSSCCRQFQFDSYLALARELRAQQDAAGGDGHRCPWPGEWATNPAPDLEKAASRGAHPVLGLLYDANSISAVDDVCRTSEVLDFPATPMALAAEALNSLLEPIARLDLKRLTGMDILSLTTLCTQASENGTVTAFWRGPRGASSQHSPRAMLLWAIDTAAAAGQPISVEFFDANQPLRSLLDEQHTSMRAHVVQALMSHAILASPPSPAEATEPRQARRAARAL